jgi:hypothetical protein
MAIHRETVWRKRQIILPEPLVHRIDQWHGGQHTAVYALASTGRQDLVSLSMIDAALADLKSDERLARGKQRTELKHAVSGLHEVRHFWREHSAKEAGLESDPDFGYEYDRKDYGMSASEEASISTRSG